MSKQASLRYLRFDGLLQQSEWMSPAYVGVDNAGNIQYLSDKPINEGSAVEVIHGYLLPGFQNTHSHAFQYAMAGLAENHSSSIDDDFWTWREEMYKCALLVDPDDAEAIAAMLYSEMLRHGYTRVAEFHYLHHDKDGKAYANLAEMGERMISAANTAGINITLVPVFYQKGGFGTDPQPRQRRFISRTVEDYFKLFDASKKVVNDHPVASLGFSVHSLRAVDLTDVITTFQQGPRDLPFHIHVSEQKKEVEDCIAYSGKRPMEWLLENLPVNDRFNLVHSTHLNDAELKKLAATGANVVLCPSTEGNLGDGIFRMKEYCQMGGHWSIGTDSHIGLNPFEEFRMIDYRQRLVTNKRNTFRDDGAKYMINESIIRGGMGMGITRKNHFQIGQSLDGLVINSQSPLLQSTQQKNILSALVYTGDSGSHLGTLVNGRWIVKDQIHKNQESIRQKFKATIHKLGNR